MDPAEAPLLPEPPSARDRPRMQRPRLWTLGWLAWFTVLCILSSMSSVGPQIDVIGIDKFYHAVYFAIGGTLLLLALALRGKTARAALDGSSWRKLALAVFLTGAAVGWLDEWHQSFTPGRSGLDVYDWLADLTGSLAALPVARLFLRWLAWREERACRMPRATP